MCISPCADSGFSQENALSMRAGLPSSASSQVVGAVWKPRCGPSSGVGFHWQWGVGWALAGLG